MQTDAALRLATVVVPVAVYFLILGILNSRRSPQLLTGRADLLILLGVLSPLAIVPTAWLSAQAGMMLAACIVGWFGLELLRSPAPRWVIYNLPPDAARRVIADVLASVTGQVRTTEKGFSMPACDAEVEITSFPLLRNTSLRLRGGDEKLSGTIGLALADKLSAMPAENPAMATALLLVATGMLAAPLSLLAPRAVQLVRQLTDLLY